MTKFQEGKRWDSNLHMDVCPIPRSPPCPLRQRSSSVLSGLRQGQEASRGVEVAMKTARRTVVRPPHNVNQKSPTSSSK
ncbi:hypothetical protein E2C01_067868 [Portunus trituberculatus]|uniref:Uncharacterized protein n=1 Tax=Portunus trituberculatus TaxID=210409 RepID=A0A5B7HUS9_PORTR|nr:hypothetical protein [Portunus trituberculatus]